MILLYTILCQIPFFDHSKRVLRTLGMGLVLLGLATACAPVSRLAWNNSNALEKSGYEFIRDGVSTRDDLLARLGAPSYKFENKRVLIYSFQQDTNRLVHLSASAIKPVGYVRDGNCNNRKAGHVVMIFTEDGVLDKHQVVIPKGIPGSGEKC